MFPPIIFWAWRTDTKRVGRFFQKAPHAFLLILTEFFKIR